MLTLSTIRTVISLWSSFHIRPIANIVFNYQQKNAARERVWHVILTQVRRDLEERQQIILEIKSKVESIKIATSLNIYAKQLESSWCQSKPQNTKTTTLSRRWSTVVVDLKNPKYARKTAGNVLVGCW